MTESTGVREHVTGYRLQIGNYDLTISGQIYYDLQAAIAEHERNGFRDGETRLGRIVITEVAYLP